MRGNYLILPGTDHGQANDVNEKASVPYTEICVYKSDKRPKSINREKMLYLRGDERFGITSRDAITLFRKLVPHH